MARKGGLGSRASGSESASVVARTVKAMQGDTGDKRHARNVHFERDVHKALRLLSVEEETTAHALIMEGLALLFADRGKKVPESLRQYRGESIAPDSLSAD